MYQVSNEHLLKGSLQYLLRRHLSSVLGSRGFITSCADRHSPNSPTHPDDPKHHHRFRPQVCVVKARLSSLVLNLSLTWCSQALESDLSKRHCAPSVVFGVSPFSIPHTLCFSWPTDSLLSFTMIFFSCSLMQSDMLPFMPPLTLLNSFHSCILSEVNLALPCTHLLMVYSLPFLLSETFIFPLYTHRCLTSFHTRRWVCPNESDVFILCKLFCRLWLIENLQYRCEVGCRTRVRGTPVAKWIATDGWWFISLFYT